MKDLHGKTAVVTGAGGGIGRSIALALADQGMNVVVVDIEEDAARTVAEEAMARGVSSLAAQCDVSRLSEVEALAEAAYGRFGTVEVLANNAGVTLRPFRASWDTDYSDFQWLMNVNFWGVLHGHHVFVPRMRDSPGEKHIVNTSSMASLGAFAGHSAYSASKAAVDGFSNSVREELKTQNIGLTVLHPGLIRTRIASSERLRPDQERSENRGVKPWSDYAQQVSSRLIDKGDAGDPTQDRDVASSPSEYITPNAVGGLVVRGIVENLPVVLTHPARVESLQARFDAILAGQPPTS